MPSYRWVRAMYFFSMPAPSRQNYRLIYVFFVICCRIDVRCQITSKIFLLRRKSEIVYWANMTRENYFHGDLIPRKAIIVTGHKISNI